MAEDRRSARDLVQVLRGKGLSVRDIATELQRDPRMVRKVLNGETSGERYRASLLELASTGRTTQVPPRRRGKDGQVVPVRAKRGAAEKTVVPEDTGGRYADAKQGGRYSSTTYFGGEDRQIEHRIPKGKTTKGRQAATAELLRNIRSAARGQKGNQKRVKLTLTYANGRVMEVNDYNASTLLSRVKSTGGDTLGWLAAQSAARYSNLDTSKTPITGVTMTVYSAPKTDQYRRAHG